MNVLLFIILQWRANLRQVIKYICISLISVFIMHSARDNTVLGTNQYRYIDMIESKITPNELAKLEMFDRMTLAFYDGVNGTAYAGDKISSREEAEVYRHMKKHTDSIRKQWGIDKILRKAQY